MVTGSDLRAVMRLYPAGVSVVTADADGNRIGVTVGSLVSLSLDPALVGISIGRELALHEVLRDAGAFGVSLLRADQEDVALHFARGMPPIALWSRFETRPGQTGAPLLDGALGWLECTVVAEHPVGDHTFFVGEVVGTGEGEPGPALVYREHTYVSAGPT
jgi:flavin reductase (DIM6/NTAB) family NADH-FMN oxidoreductase RutF